jgi:hypothetical protein
MDNILELLKNDREYYSGIGKSYLSNSDIGTLLSNPQDYGKSRGDNKSFAEGRYFHQLILEPEKAAATPFVDASTRTTNIYKNFCEDNNLEYVLLWKEMVEVQKLVDTMKQNITFYDEIYRDGNVFEMAAVGKIQGEMWKGKADIVGDDSLIDLKTTSDINKFKWSAKSYNYDSQCYIYQELFGKPLVFFAIDKVTAQMGIFRPSDEFIKGGEYKVAQAIKVYRKYFGANPEDNIVNHFINEIL